MTAPEPTRTDSPWTDKDWCTVRDVVVRGRLSGRLPADTTTDILTALAPRVADLRAAHADALDAALDVQERLDAALTVIEQVRLLTNSRTAAWDDILTLLPEREAS